MEFNLIKDWYLPDKWNCPNKYIRVYKVGEFEFEEVQTRYNDDSCDLYILGSMLHDERGIVLDNTCGIRCNIGKNKAITNFSIKLLANNVIKLKDYKEFLDVQIEAYKCATALYNRYVENINEAGYYLADGYRGAYLYSVPTLAKE